MKLAYTLDQFSALESAAGYFDLHNCYDVVHAHCTGDRSYVRFEKIAGEWVKPEAPAHLTLVFEQVSFFQVSEGLQFPIGLDFIAFKELADQDLTCFMAQPGNDPVHLLLGLDNDAFIRIGATSAFCLPSSLA
ncbi:MAG: hypothetical protein EOO61_16925 [Hymenobacter sp.]|nr:MAG: hypothetical protein EOO61_16925 [Hymenobacter sp.]